jgi:hypothetical protein
MASSKCHAGVTTDTSELRGRLVDMRAALVERLAKRMDGGDLALLGSVGAALATLDAMPPIEAEAAPQDHGERPVERSPSLRGPRSVEPGPAGEGNAPLGEP